tara:strand:+ start:438 stop:1058 length:621 start_codon:yes stop_codon:yes gene_type:complete
MKLSYAITVCDEFVEIQKLIPFLLKHKRHEDEIVVLYDSKNGSKSIETFLRAKSINGEFSWYMGEFGGHFANWKNKLTDYCSGDYIFQIDADEMPTTYMLDMIPEVLTHNDIDILKVPRINTVEGLTQEHIEKWQWGVNDLGWVNFPDFQWRIYKNNNSIKWVNQVHEVLVGYRTISYLPTLEEWCLRHDKTIERQERQNKLYNEL